MLFACREVELNTDEWDTSASRGHPKIYTNRVVSPNVAALELTHLVPRCIISVRYQL